MGEHSHHQPRADLPVLGRDRERAILGSAVAALGRGRGGTLLIDGEPGIGKSTLLHSVATEAVNLGCMVFIGAAHELEDIFPLGLVCEALQVHPASADPRRASIARALRGTGRELLLDGPDPVAVACEQVRDLVDDTCTHGPVLLVLDDLQFADPASLTTWTRLAELARQQPLLLVGACRPVPVPDGLQAILDGHPAGSGERITLDALAPGDVLDIAANLLHAPPGPALRQHLANAAGNPLYVVEVLTTLLRSGRLHTTEGTVDLADPAAEDQLPGSLAEAVAGRLAFLPVELGTLLELAAVVGGEFTLGEVAAVAGLAESDTATLLAGAEAAGVLRRAGKRLAFRHPLLRQALYSRTPDAVRRALHLQVAEVLVGTSGPAERVAEHLLRAGEPLRDGAREWLLRTSVELTHRMPPTAMDLCALALAASGVSPSQRGALATIRAEALYRAGRFSEAVQAAGDTLAQVDDPPLRRRLHWAFLLSLFHSGSWDEAFAAADAALRDAGTDGGRSAEILAMTANCHHLQGDPEGEAAAMAHRAVETGRRHGASRAVGYAFLLLGMQADDPAEALALYQEGLDAAPPGLEHADVRQWLMRAQWVALYLSDRKEECGATLRVALREAEQAGGVLAGTMYGYLAGFHIGFGQWDDAFTDVQTGLRLPMRNHDRTLLVGAAAYLAARRDDVAAAREHVRDGLSAMRSSGDRESGGWLRWARALLYERDSRDRDALDVMADLVANPLTVGFASQRLAYPVDAVRLAVRCGEHSLATDAARALEPDARRLPSGTSVAALLHCDGLVRADPEPLLRAAACYQTASRPSMAADANADAALALAARGDFADARRALSAAEDTYHRLGAQWDLIRTAARAREAGLRSTTPRRASRPRYGWAALTDTEAKVAELVTEGRSNSEIAAHLLLSVRTVQTHVSHILRKLDATSRVEVVRHRTMTPAPGTPTPA